MVVQRRCAKYWALKSPSICMSLDLGKGSKEIRKRKPRAESDGVFKAGGRGWRDCRHHSMVLNSSPDDWFRRRGQKGRHRVGRIQESKRRWCRLRGLNSRPSVYKTAALPLS